MTCSALAAMTSLGYSNLLLNPGFETGALDPWFMDREWGTSGMGQVWQTTTSQAHSGAWSAYCESDKELRQNVAPMPGSSVASFSFWAKIPEPFGVVAAMVYYSDQTYRFYSNQQASTDWHFWDMTFMIDPNKTVVGFGANGYRGGGPFPDLVYVDDFRVEAVPEPATLIASGLGLATWAGRRRRVASS